MTASLFLRTYFVYFERNERTREKLQIGQLCDKKYES